MAQTYSLCEIAKNNGQNGKPVWIIVKGVVYDVTEFLQNHPGGEELILEYAGKDATKAFNNAGHSVDAIQDMKLYKIGIVNHESSQQCRISPISTTTATDKMDPQYGRQEKKRLKLFFCF